MGGGGGGAGRAASAPSARVSMWWRHALTHPTPSDSVIDSSMSGTTGVVGCLRGRDLYVANIGDSRAIIGSVGGARSGGGSGGGAGGDARGDAGRDVRGYPVSEDHKPDAPAEKARIVAAGGRVHACTYEDGVEGPARVWLAEDDIPGLAMSRSLGDGLAHSVGVSSQPDLFYVALKPEHKWVVLASDGLWEFMSNDEVVGIVAKHAGAVHAALDALVAEAGERWMANESVIDDTTVILVEMKDAK